MTPGADHIPVEQVDRIAAAPYLGFAYQRCLDGECDSHDLVQLFARHRLRARTEADRSVREALSEGEWFYPEGDHSSDECRFSPDEVIDYALEADSVTRVIAIERAMSLPTVYAAVRVWSDAEKDDRESDDDYDYTLHATADEARAALTGSNPAVNGSEG